MQKVIMINACWMYECDESKILEPSTHLQALKSKLGTRNIFILGISVSKVCNMIYYRSYADYKI